MDEKVRDEQVMQAGLPERMTMAVIFTGLQWHGNDATTTASSSYVCLRLCHLLYT